MTYAVRRLAALALCISQPAVAQSPMTRAEFDAELNRLARVLQSVYEVNIRAGINSVPHYFGRAGDLAMVYVDGCDLAPRYEPRSTPPSVRLKGRELIALSQALSQVVLFYTIGIPELSKPHDVAEVIAQGFFASPPMRVETTRCPCKTPRREARL